ncbi:MAG: bifunctional phosphoribosylaminoimidazolecarboxamide formyltransferase/IMP cyclohydrolase [Phycisphaerales bacterium]|nr:bifunctional phosphoribosylaminoimidazolecarboxamide formyltransferase/IMP cyclohydrolase [Phycisphaerales bacterium]
MSDLVPVRRALISVSDKRDVVAFARALVEHGVDIISTGGTAAMLRAQGIKVVPIEEFTGFPEMLDGRVKTLHPRVHGGLLGRRDSTTHLQAMAEHGILPIDLVCVNLYPFESTVLKSGVTEEEAIENIDIGGPSMIRSAAKNFSHVCVVTSPQQYDRVCSDLRAHCGSTTGSLRRELAAAAFSRTAAYDGAIAGWFDSGSKWGSKGASEGASKGDFPNALTLSFTKSEELRYGENPHQRAAVYMQPGATESTVVGAPLLHGKPLSYNNLLDASAALELVQDLSDLDDHSCACAIIKHTNPCGAAMAGCTRDAFLEAYGGDPVAAYGSVVAFNGVVDAAAAEVMIAGDRFLEVVIAERFDAPALDHLSQRWKNVRLIALGPIRHRIDRPLSVRSIPGGVLLQERDTLPLRSDAFKHVAGPPPTSAVLTDAVFAFMIAKHLKSNAVCIACEKVLWGGGAGQMDRIASCAIAIEKSKGRLTNSSALVPVAGSDAFFPFSDGPELLIRAGVKCIVHPGGSKRDADTTELCAKHGVTCLIAGSRHFRH